jgi:hypothetical protein
MNDIFGSDNSPRDEERNNVTNDGSRKDLQIFNSTDE